MELDFYEAYVAQGARFKDEFVGTVHEMNTRINADHANYGSNTKVLKGTD